MIIYLNALFTRVRRTPDREGRRVGGRSDRIKPLLLLSRHCLHITTLKAGRAPKCGSAEEAALLPYRRGSRIVCTFTPVGTE